MSNNGVEQIVIRHVSGSKANQIEHISLAGVNEITIGRDPKSNIAFDASRDDIVSRRHAAIRVVRGDRISFRLADLGSMHGTFLNGERIKDEVELLPEDSVGLGKTGVKFIFDVQPRPAYMVARTRVIDISDAAATRVVEAAGIAARDAVSASEMSAGPATQKFEPPPKVGVGKETVLHLLGEERRATSRVWTSSLAALAAFVALGGGAFYWKQLAQNQSLKAEIDSRADSMAKHAEEEERKREAERGLSPEYIVKTFGNATAEITAKWRLYDQKTGKPVFHQTMVDSGVDERGNKRSGEFPAYVRSGDEKQPIVRWLTLEDDNRTNIPIGAAIAGTGFVVDEQGFMLTNKHMTAAWRLAFGDVDPANEPRYGYGWLYDYKDLGPAAREAVAREAAREAAAAEAAKGGKGKKKPPSDVKKPTVVEQKLPTLIDLNNPKYRFLQEWVPSSGGFIFQKDQAIMAGGGNIPDPSKGETLTFLGRNDVLEVRFANSRLSANANLARSSNESDAALIKVDTPQQLKKVVLAPNDNVKEGESVMAIGYPAVASKTKVKSFTIEAQQERTTTDTVPAPFVTTGIVSVISPAVKTENGVSMWGEIGDIIQMSINSTGAGNSGGPVFNKEGKVIGIYTYGINRGGANTSGAIPIRYGRDLLETQHR